LKHFGRRKGFTLSDDQWIELNWRWYETLADYAKVVPGSVDALRDLADMGLKIGLLSNTFVHASSLERHMANVGLLDLLPVRMYSTMPNSERRVFIASIFITPFISPLTSALPL